MKFPVLGMHGQINMFSLLVLKEKRFYAVLTLMYIEIGP